MNFHELWYNLLELLPLCVHTFLCLYTLPPSPSFLQILINSFPFANVDYFYSGLKQRENQEFYHRQYGCVVNLPWKWRSRLRTSGWMLNTSSYYVRRILSPGYRMVGHRARTWLGEYYFTLQVLWPISKWLHIQEGAYFRKRSSDATRRQPTSIPGICEFTTSLNNASTPSCGTVATCTIWTSGASIAGSIY